MTERPQTNETERENQQRLSDRRQLLKMGAAGLPMVLTLKASAQQVVISQLQCAFVLPRRVRILVNCDGAAWVGRRRVRYRNGQGWKVADLNRFKNEADYIFPAGTVPNSYRPSACPEVVCSGDDDDDNGGNNINNGVVSELEALLNAPMPSNAAEIANFNGRSKKDDDDDDSCDPEWQDNGYTLYTLSRNTEIKPSDFLNGTSWNPTGTRGLYLILSMTYANSYGNAGGWPGISCVASILTYLGQL